MATKLSESLTQDSDETKEMYCEECEKHTGAYATAEAFCVNCVEYKCKTCQEYHKRHFKAHTIYDSGRMPQDFYFEKCSLHPKQLIKFYCLECNIEGCQECKDNDHENCRNVNHLPTLASGIQKSNELNDIKLNMDTLSEDMNNIKKLLKAKCELIDKQEENIIKACKEYTDKLIATYKQQHQYLIDDFDKQMEDSIAKLKKERSELIQRVSEKERKFEVKVRKAETVMKEEVVNTNTNFKKLKSKHLSLTKDFEILSSDLKHAQKIGQNCKLFIKLKLAKHKCKQIQLSTGKIQDAFIQGYKLEPFKIQTTAQSLEKETTFFSLVKVHVSALERGVTFNSDMFHQVRNVSSLLVLSEHTLLTSDWYTKSLVIYKQEQPDQESFTEFKFDKYPHGLTKITDYKVVVTFPDDRKIRLITFSKDMKILNITEIPGNGHCRGIVYSNNHLVVSYWNPSCVKILNMSGKIVKSFDNENNCQNLFSNPLYLTVSPDNTMIYVSDCDKNTVTCLTFDGMLKSIYKDEKLNYPHQLAVDDFGSVCVCGQDSNNIHQLSRNLNKVKILIDKSHGINTPTSIAYCQNTKRLFVGMDCNRKIKIFNVTLE
ncbi:uncharacterized protein LOC132758899 [Ruditapes philippinarum]|uniref:uncharacterized protein LOC132758899 n=1 Tax=Ruditapes philippinarum TaxID=129788 RepID=UPI00295B87BF|nr:uncharacterized protein LOC132758899 [Ruditapes philippinarum]